MCTSYVISRLKRGELSDLDKNILYYLYQDRDVSDICKICGTYPEYVCLVRKYAKRDNED